MKKQFSEPKIAIVELDATAIIAESGTGATIEGGGGMEED